MNLLNNAIDAIDQRGKQETGHPRSQISIENEVTGSGYSGQIRISTQWIEVGLRKQVQVNIEDNGAGIPEAVRDKIFDPFFTTREVGKGTGLGLSICHGIIEKHGGSITFESTVNMGTSFTVTLPVDV